jgi:tetratricopeptide (TPR) repeat protein
MYVRDQISKTIVNQKVKLCILLVLAFLLAGCSSSQQAARWQDRFDYGMMHLLAGNYELAVDAFTLVIQIDPQRVHGHLRRGDANMELLLYTDAVADYEQALTLDAEFVDIYMKLADAYLALEEADRAQSTLEQGLATTGYEAIAVKLAALHDKDVEYFEFGNYQGEPLKWQVLADESDRLLIITKDSVALKEYHIPSGNTIERYDETITWEECTLRSWLNHSFYEEAFTASEKSRIQEIQNTNPNMVYDIVTFAEGSINPKIFSKVDTRGGKDTRDRVFLLSYIEAEQYFADDAARIARHSWTAEDVANTELEDGEGAIANSWARWWLRSPGGDKSYAAFVERDGSINKEGRLFFRESYSVRPAMYISR